MPIKITQLTTLGTVDGTVVIPVVDIGGVTPISKRSTVADLSTFILQGNAATATNLASSTTTLASTVVSSSLTSVGTLGNLTVTNTISGSINGNAATATKLATARNINGVAFDGSADISITTALATASDTIKGGVIIPLVGTSGITNSSGTIGLAVATSSQLGGVKIGAGINVAVDGTLSGPTRKFHGFDVDANSNLIYYTTEDTTINLQDSTGADIYEDVDIGTNEYAYSLDADGNLIVTYS
jgi:hypothetical protein